MWTNRSAKIKENLRKSWKISKNQRKSKENQKKNRPEKKPQPMQGAAATSKPVVPFGTFVTVVVPARLFFRPTRVGPRFSKLQQTGSGAQADECTPSRFKTVRGGNLPANPDQSVSPAPPPFLSNPPLLLLFLLGIVVLFRIDDRVRVFRIAGGRLPLEGVQRRLVRFWDKKRSELLGQRPF